MTMLYIRNFYGVPAYRGARVRFKPDSRDKPMVGRVTSSDGAHIRCRFEGSSKPWKCHPMWQMEYMTPNGWWNPETRSHSSASPPQEK